MGHDVKASPLTFLLPVLALLPVLLAPRARAAPAASTVSALQIPLEEWRLKNGLRVIFSPRHEVPAVSVQVWYHVGSKDERPGIRGIAHLFEHMMFKGSRHVPPEAHARMISALGGEDNAFTSQDMTAYHNTLPRQYLEFALRLEAERMQHLHLSPATIKSEREVVKEEKRLRLENSPIGRALEAIHALAFTRHPYAWTPAGDIPDLNRVTQEDCQRFYETYYGPQNATVIVVGDTTLAEVRGAVERTFAAIPRGSAPPRVTVEEPPQQEEREQIADWPSQLRVVLGAYHVPRSSHADLPALRVASAILSAGRSSRLNQALVRRGKLAVSAGGFLQAAEQPGLLFIYGVGLPGHDARRIKASLLQEVARLSRGAVSVRELAKVKNQLATAQLGQLETASGLAERIGRSTILHGDPRDFLSEVARLDAVTAADVKRVAQAYLQRRNLTLVLLDPPAKGGKR